MMPRVLRLFDPGTPFLREGEICIRCGEGALRYIECASAGKRQMAKDLLDFSVEVVNLTTMSTSTILQVV